jgi:hypothetical protein
VCHPDAFFSRIKKRLDPEKLRSPYKMAISATENLKGPAFGLEQD